MRILIGTGLNSGDAEYRNIGDVAMLQAAVARVSEIWPESEVQVLTDSATSLARFCPSAKPLPRDGARTWIGDRVLLGQLHRVLPNSVSDLLSSAKQKVRAEHPALLRAMLDARFRIRDSEGRREKLESFISAMQSCKLLLICGSGGFADSCRDWNLYTLGLIEAAIVSGVPVALSGQGIGPISDRHVISRMRRLLPRVALLASRGTQGADAIAREIGVPSNVFFSTGDDTVEPAFAARPEKRGSGIGVNLRIASYSGISEQEADAIGGVLRDFASSRKASLIPLPIATHDYANDARTIARLLGTDISEFSSLDSPQLMYKQTARCRVVVTGAYHAAVFALSQGIPTICISASEYYLCKFAGLKTLFGAGCTVLDLKQLDVKTAVSNSLGRAWDEAELVCEHLLKAAQKQICANREAFSRLEHMFARESDLPVRSDSVPVSIP